MPRSMTLAMASALAQPVLRPAIFVQINFLTGPVYIWSGLGSISWNSQTWLGVGTLGGISMVEDGATVQPRSVTLTLSGIDPSTLAGALQESCQELPLTIWLGLFDSSGNLIPSPVVIWSGLSDQPTIEVSGDSAIISLNGESRLLEMNVSRELFYTQDQQALDHPGDQAFNWVNSIQELQLMWGLAPISGPNV